MSYEDVIRNKSDTNSSFVEIIDIYDLINVSLQNTKEDDS